MHKKILIVFFITLLITSCNNSVNFSELVERDNTYYKVNNEKPFTGSVLDYHNKDKKIKKIEGDFKNGKFNGKWIEYYSNGQIKKIWNYNIGVKNGKFIEYRDNGQIVKEEEFKNGKKNGKFTEYKKNGQIIKQAEYLNGKANGKWVSYFNNGNKDEVVEYKNGLKDGLYIKYFKSSYSNNGELENFSEKGNYIMDNKDGEWKYKDNGGAVIKIENYNDGLLNGYFEETFWNNQKRMQLGNSYSKKLYKRFGNYKSGTKDGVWTLLEDNEPKLVYNIENGINITLEGYWEWKWEGTDIVNYSHYNNGKVASDSSLSGLKKYRNYYFNDESLIEGETQYEVWELSENKFIMKIPTNGYVIIGKRIKQ